MPKSIWKHGGNAPVYGYSEPADLGHFNCAGRYIPGRFFTESRALVPAEVEDFKNLCFSGNPAWRMTRRIFLMGLLPVERLALDETRRVALLFNEPTPSELPFISAEVFGTHAD